MIKRMSPVIRKLGLGGGGAKGILHIGALMELSKHQPLVFPDGIYGSSVGSVIASCIAFGIPIETILEFVKTNSSVQKLIPSKFEVQNISKLFTSKGFYDMNIFKTRMIELFKTANIDIQNKKLKDAEMPLYLVSSNITKGVPTIFSGDVYVLDALRCSCCIPFLFHPQQVGDSLYVDGNILTPNLTSICSADTIIINLNKHRRHSIMPSQLESLSAFEYAKELYNIVTIHNEKSQSSVNTVSLSYPNLYSDSDLSEFNIDEILADSGNQFSRFLSSKVLS
jgi:predicted acylesterase/phospholipase RssA